MHSGGRAAVRLLQKIADPFKLVERAGGRDDEHLVEADALEALQPLARLVRQADERYLGALGEAPGFGSGAELVPEIPDRAACTFWMRFGKSLTATLLLLT